MILFNESIKFINDKSEIFDQNIKCDNLISNTNGKLNIGKYTNKNLSCFVNIEFKAINNPVSLDDNTFIAIGLNQFLYYN